MTPFLRKMEYKKDGPRSLNLRAHTFLLSHDKVPHFLAFHHDTWHDSYVEADQNNPRLSPYPRHRVATQEKRTAQYYLFFTKIESGTWFELNHLVGRNLDLFAWVTRVSSHASSTL